jgi:NTP pyrophosphatase (non-canonical NTP hydrolase)
MTNDELKIYIADQLGTAELLCQLAEEAAELSKAALKLRRAITGFNPTPVTVDQARDNLVEEMADVYLCLDLLGFRSFENLCTTGEIEVKKLQRWAGRLGLEE